MVRHRLTQVLLVPVYIDSLVMISIERSETAQENALDVRDKLK